jgi:hypothetical protein
MRRARGSGERCSGSFTIGCVMLRVALAASLSVAPPAEAAIGRTVLCESTSYSCVGGTGYVGQANWGYPGPHNCTLYAAYRLVQNGYSNPGGLGNAYDWDANALSRGATVNASPTVGSIGQRDGSGHVMYVEEVKTTYIVVTEDNWAGPTRRVRIDRPGEYFSSLEFIHFKDIVRPSERNDVFQAAGGTVGWRLSANGRGAWENLRASTTTTGLMVGDFNNDGVDDIFQAAGDGVGWRFSSKGRGSWETLQASSTTQGLLIGDFE